MLVKNIQNIWRLYKGHHLLNQSWEKTLFQKCPHHIFQQKQNQIQKEPEWRAEAVLHKFFTNQILENKNIELTFTKLVIFGKGWILPNYFLKWNISRRLMEALRTSQGEFFFRYFCCRNFDLLTYKTKRASTQTLAEIHYVGFKISPVFTCITYICPILYDCMCIFPAFTNS